MHTLYVFAMPDLRGSITSDIDDHLTLSRLEAVCPPDAKRPHHQDAYLVSRFPEPPGMAGPGDASWDYWQAKTDLMRRVVAKFLLRLKTPSFNEDVLGRRLHEALPPTVKLHAAKLA